MRRQVRAHYCWRSTNQMLRLPFVSYVPTPTLRSSFPFRKRGASLAKIMNELRQDVQSQPRVPLVKTKQAPFESRHSTVLMPGGWNSDLSRQRIPCLVSFIHNLIAIPLDFHYNRVALKLNFSNLNNRLNCSRRWNLSK